MFNIFRFKNVQGKIIVIADSDESLSSKFATTMIQRGYDNVFVLSGGLRVAKIKVSSGFYLIKNTKRHSQKCPIVMAFV